MKKRIVSLLLILCMTLTLLPTTILAADTAEPIATGEEQETPSAGGTIYVDAVKGDDTNDGSEAHPYQTVEKAVTAAASGATIQLAAGTYTLYGKDGIAEEKSLTFVGAGTKKTTWNIGTPENDTYSQGNGDYGFRGAKTLIFRNMTLKAGVTPSGTVAGGRDYMGFAHTDKTIVEDCVIEGKTFYWGYESAEFTNTTFNCPIKDYGFFTVGDYALWTYSSPVMTFDNCTFNSSGKVINVYTDFGAGKNDITVNFKDCTVVNNGASLKSVLNINDSNMGSCKYFLNISGKNSVSGVSADEITCSRLFGFGGKEASNSGRSVVKFGDTIVWQDGKMVDAETYHNEGVTVSGVSYDNGVAGENGILYAEGYKDSQFPVKWNDWTTGQDGKLHRTGTRTCNYCGYSEDVEETKDLCPVKLVIYRNGDTSNSYKTVDLGSQPKGTVIDLSTIDIGDYYTANYTGNYDFYGWYNDGKWNTYTKNPANPPAGLEEITVNGWTNLKCMVYDYEKVVYFNTAEDLKAYQNHDDAVSPLFSTIARKGSTLPTADAPTATREGYTFTFWSREGQTVDVTDQTVNGWTNLYANWEKDEYTISYDLRDGKAENSSENPTTYTVEDVIELKAPTTKRDNKFLEWRDEDGNVVTEIKKGTTGNIKLYAYWKCPIKLYEVTDTGEKVQLGETIYLPEGTTYQLPEGTEYAKIGYSFNCWFASEKDLNAEKNRKSEVTTSVEKEWKLYGKNVPIEYTITYDYRDKDVTGKAWLQPDNRTAYTVETDTFQINPVTEKGESGKVFLEWRDKDGTVVNEITKGTTGNITLYAYWKYPVNYTLKRLDKDGKAVETTKDTDLFIEDDFDEFKLKSVSRDGYTFSGWYEFENLTGACTAITTPKKYELYGTLTPNTNTAYTVEHYLENLDGSYPTDASYTEPLTGTTDTFVTAKAQDYTGFTYSDSASEKTKSGYIAGDGTLVLKLYYTRNSYNVNFYVDGTKADDMTKSVKYQGKVAEPTMDIKTGYAFDGWYTDATYTAAYKFDETQVTNNLDLYGRYIANTYTVKFDGNGATSGTMANQTFTYDVAQKLTKNAFAKTGYTFVGWKDGSDNTYTDEQEVMNLIAVQGGVVILTAQWTADPIAVDISQYVYKQYVQKYNRKDTTTFTFTAEVYPKAEISSGSGSAVVLANPLIDTVKGEVKIDSSKNGEVKQVTFEKTDKLSAGRYYVYITENKGTNSYITYDNSGYVLNIRVFDNGRTGLEVKLIDIDKVTENGQMETTGGNTVTFVNTYTRASRPSTSSTSKPTLNTGDHFAYVMGYPDGTVRPNGSITRAEVSTILFRLLSDKTRDEYFTTESSFTDVKAGAWYNNSIATLEKTGVIVDTAKGGAFRPNEAITRAELAAMLAQFADAKPVKGMKFSDVSADHWAYDAIAIAAKMGWIEGYPDGTFRPDATITRAEMMTLVNRALERVPSDEDHLLSKRAMLTFPDCTTRDWFYIAVQEATNSHSYERAATEKNGDEQWTALRDNRDWTKFEQ